MSILAYLPTQGELDQEEQARVEREAPPERPFDEFPPCPECDGSGWYRYAPCTMCHSDWYL